MHELSYNEGGNSIGSIGIVSVLVLVWICAVCQSLELSLHQHLPCRAVPTTVICWDGSHNTTTIQVGLLYMHGCFPSLVTFVRKK